MRLYMDSEHYVLLTGKEGERIFLFDPYYMEELPFGEGIECDFQHPREYNRIVPVSCFNRAGELPYAMGAVEEREAVLIFDTRTKRTPERTIEYFI